jgi:hypothetical protein
MYSVQEYSWIWTDLYDVAYRITINYQDRFSVSIYRAWKFFSFFLMLLDWSSSHSRNFGNTIAIVRTNKTGLGYVLLQFKNPYIGIMLGIGINFSCDRLLRSRLIFIHTLIYIYIYIYIQDDQKVFLHMLITVQKPRTIILNGFNHLPW